MTGKRKRTNTKKRRVEWSKLDAKEQAKYQGEADKNAENTKRYRAADAVPEKNKDGVRVKTSGATRRTADAKIAPAPASAQKRLKNVPPKPAKVPPKFTQGALSSALVSAMANNIAEAAAKQKKPDPSGFIFDPDSGTEKEMSEKWTAKLKRRRTKDNNKRAMGKRFDTGDAPWDLALEALALLGVPCPDPELVVPEGLVVSPLDCSRLR